VGVALVGVALVGVALAAREPDAPARAVALGAGVCTALPLPRCHYRAAITALPFVRLGRTPRDRVLFW
jgi:hypothetical protein